MTLGQYLDIWLEVYARQLALKTYESYRDNIELHIKPALGDIKLAELRTIDLQLYYAEAGIIVS